MPQKIYQVTILIIEIKDKMTNKNRIDDMSNIRKN